MQSILELYKKTKKLHQAYLLEGNVQSIIKELNPILEEILATKIIGNPDCYVCETEVFDVPESKRLRQTSQKKSVSGGKRFFVIGAESFLEQAQNSLLKTLEEPIEGNHFFIIVPNKRQILPTVISRLTRIDVDVDKKIEIKNDNVDLCNKFLASSVADRILMIGEIVKEKEEPRIQRSVVRKFILCLEQVIFNKYKRGNLEHTSNIQNIIMEISKLADYSLDPSSASKLLLEYLTLICPIVEENKKK